MTKKQGTWFLPLRISLFLCFERSNTGSLPQAKQIKKESRAAMSNCLLFGDLHQALPLSQANCNLISFDRNDFGRAYNTSRHGIIQLRQLTRQYYCRHWLVVSSVVPRWILRQRQSCESTNKVVIGRGAKWMVIQWKLGLVENMVTWYFFQPTKIFCQILNCKMS